MLNCPFCGSDYSEIGLRDGRCRNCGSVLAWDEEPASQPVPQIAPQPAIQPALSPDPASPLVSPKRPVPDQSAIQRTVDVNDLSREQQGAIPEQRPTGFTRTLASDSSAPEPATAPPTPVPAPSAEQLSMLWNPEEIPGAHPLMTIKGNSSKETYVSGSVLSIQSRTVQREAEPVEGDTDYELLTLIGQGGIGLVYSARQSSIDRNVALKMLRPEFEGRPEHRDKFLAEAVVTGELDHPNIVPIYDLGRSRTGELFYSMKHVRGTPWDQVIHRKSNAENLEILLNVADAIAFAHSRGIIHRDLKPENVMLGDFGEVLVMDWGIALPTAEFRKHGSITQSLAMGGTPAYMAPEMATGPVERITFRSDVYLLGAILFEIVSGTPPHNGKDVMQCVLAAARNEIVTTQASGELLEIALRAMSTRPEDRFATVQDFQNALHDYQSHHESILLGERADGLMVEASQSGEYETYSRALFAYQEAAALWAGNEHAITGINNAKLAYAQRALTKGDFDLGLSLLVANDPRHTPLRQALLRAQRERDARQMRLKSVRRLVVLLTLFILVSGGYALFFIYEQWQDTEIARDKASQLNEELKAKQNELTSQIARVRAAEGVARENTRLALEQKTVADAERQRADELRLEAIQSRQRAEEQAYFSEVGLAGEKLSGTAYGVAREILNGLAKSPAKSKLRHWEWAHYAYVSNGGRTNDPDRPVVRVPCDQQIEALAATADQRWFIVGLSKGELQIRSGSDLSIVHSWRGGQSIRDLDISTDGQTLITTGLSESGASVVTQWNWQDQSQPPVRVSDLYTGDLPITAVSVQQNTSSPLIAWGNERGVITVRNPATQQSRECLGHFARVNDLTFTPSGQHLLSASEDGTVRAWNVSEAREVQRFRGHGTAVRSVAVSSDGSMIASGGSGSRILVWQFDPSLTNEALVEEVRRRVSGQPILDALYVTCTGHSGPILCLKFNAQNDLISGSQDQTLRLWDLRQIKFPTGNEMRDSQVATTVSPPSRVLRGHGGWVTGCSVSDDSRFVYSTSYDQEFRRWDTGRIGEYLTLQGPDQPIVAAEFVPNSPFIATALNDGSLALRNQQTGETVNLLQEGHQFLAAKGKFLAAGQRLATLAGDNTLRVWDTESGAELRSIPRVGRQAIADFSSDGERVLVAGDARTPAIYQLSDGQKVVDFDLFLSERKKFIQDHPDRSAVDYEAQLPVPTAVAMSPDQQFALIGTSTGLCQIWEVGSGTLKQQTQIHNESIICADIVHPPGTQDNSNWVAITASVDGSIAWFDLATGQELSQPRLKHPFPLSSAYVSDDGSQMITVAYFGKDGSRLTCWDLNAARLVNTRDLPHLQVLDVEFAALGPQSALLTTVDTQSDEKDVLTWNWSTNESTPLKNGRWRTASLWSACVTPDQAHLLTVGGRGAQRWDLKSRQEVMSYRPSVTIGALAVSPEGQTIAASTGDGLVKLWDMNSRRVRQKLLGGHQGSVTALAFSFDGKTIATAGEDGQVWLWLSDEATKAVDQPIVNSNSPIRALTFHPSGEYLVLGNDAGLIQVINWKTREVVRQWAAHRDAITSIASNSQGTWLLSTGLDKVAYTWDFATGNQLASLPGHAAGVGSAAITHDSLRIATASQDGTSKIWDARPLAYLQSSSDPAPAITLSEIMTLAAHTGDVSAVRFSPEGGDLMTAGADSQTLIWPGDDLPPGLSLSDPGANYVIGSGPQILDRAVVISEPIKTDWTNGQLIIGIAPSLGINESISVSPSAGELEVASDGQLRFFDSRQKSWLHVGDIVERGPSTYTIRLTEACSAGAIQAISRRLTFEGNPSPEANGDYVKTLQFELRDGRNRSANAAPEVKSLRCTSTANTQSPSS